MAAEQTVSEGWKAVELVVASGIGGVIVAAFTKFWVDRKLQTQKHEHDGQLESLRSELEKESTVHKLQFEKEFGLYQELWKAIVDVKRWASITPVIDNMPEGSVRLDIYKERWADTAKYVQRAIDVLEYGLPFYHRTVTGLADEMLVRYERHLGDVRFQLQDGAIEIETFRKNDEMLRAIVCTNKDIEMAIRDRIDMLHEAEIVE